MNNLRLTKTYNVTIALDYGAVTVEFDIPVESTHTDNEIFDYIMSSIEVEWDEV